MSAFTQGYAVVVDVGGDLPDTIAEAQGLAAILKAPQHGYDVTRLEETALSGAEFTARLRAIPARKLLLLLDCCHRSWRCAGAAGRAGERANGARRWQHRRPHGSCAGWDGQHRRADTRADKDALLRRLRRNAAP